ncbi:hypothetical protein [Mariniblastus fucicola]|uniref:Secreted protein n=1 Tax=Mariniblastus fucicola TaxID=980251 RepID=A0A5B9PA05_9BACT|nr:hypothetical protein [Mariniblastus fucicola]QEG22299.1 hypothetical protein MFFC18_21750 [Mariniblastus fucicola]
MKKISITFLLLVAFPIQLFAQDNQPSATKTEGVNNYFIIGPMQIDDNMARHIISSTQKSNRKQTAASQDLPVVETFPQVSKTPVAANESTPAIQQATKLQVVKEVIQEMEIAPEVVPQVPETINDVTRPLPSALDPAQPIVESETAPRQFEPVFRQDSSVQPERASLDHMRMSQPANSWDEKPSTIRNVGDHFSAGGEPFAFRGPGGHPNFFGVDRHSCCDEWAGLCNCSGGLKNNPGHLGMPWVRSKENCDTATKVLGNRRVRKPANTCGCAECCK